MTDRALPLLLALTTSLAACSGGASPEPTAPSAPGAGASEPAAAGADPASPTAAAAPAAPPPDPTTVEDCKRLAATAAPEPAAAAGEPAADSAKSDRLLPMFELMKEKRPGFRCCFDIWSGKIPEARLFTKVKFVVELDPAGKLKAATAGPEEGGPLVADEVGSCLSDVAASLDYPASASGKETKYTHHFDFKPGRRKPSAAAKP